MVKEFIHWKCCFEFDPSNRTFIICNEGEGISKATRRCGVCGTNEGVERTTRICWTCRNGFAVDPNCSFIERMQWKKMCHLLK